MGRFYLRSNSFSRKPFQLSLSKLCLKLCFLLMNLQLNINIDKCGKSEYKWKCFITWAHCVLCVLSWYFQGGRDQTLIPQRVIAKFSGSQREVSQDLIYMTELYMSDENLNEMGKENYSAKHLCVHMNVMKLHFLAYGFQIQLLHRSLLQYISAHHVFCGSFPT